MNKSTAAAASLLLCATLLTACGDAGSSSSTTKTTTVPTGRLGANLFSSQDRTEYRSCLDSLGADQKIVLQFRVRPPLDCETATKALASYIFKGKADGWDCFRTPQLINGTTELVVVCQSETVPDQDFAALLKS